MTIFRATGLPVFQNKVYRSAAEALACPVGDMVLTQDPSTGLIFNEAFDPRLMEYDEDYQNEQAVSGVFREHLSNVAAIIARHFTGRSLIEVGCGKAHFLEHLQRLGFEITGFDPAYEGSNPAVRKASFDPSAGLHADGLVLRHVLEHVSNPLEFLSQIRDANGGRGKIYIEVPCLDWIAEHRAWFDVFYEHVNYFRLADFERMFGKVHESSRTFAGQYLYVVADLATLRRPAAADSFAFPNDFLATIDGHARRLKGNRSGVIWGGSSKGVIFALYMRRAGADIATVIDINPAKQGKYIPTTGIPVRAPDDALSSLARGSEIFVMNSNYLAEIREQAGPAFEYLTIDA